jgi:hypothetical protein
MDPILDKAARKRPPSDGSVNPKSPARTGAEAGGSKIMLLSHPSRRAFTHLPKPAKAIVVIATEHQQREPGSRWTAGA